MALGGNGCPGMVHPKDGHRKCRKPEEQEPKVREQSRGAAPWSIRPGSSPQPHHVAVHESQAGHCRGLASFSIADETGIGLFRAEGPGGRNALRGEEFFPVSASLRARGGTRTYERGRYVRALWQQELDTRMSYPLRTALSPSRTFTCQQSGAVGRMSFNVFSRKCSQE